MSKPSRPRINPRMKLTVWLFLAAAVFLLAAAGIGR